jgi:hypothetical protein
LGPGCRIQISQRAADFQAGGDSIPITVDKGETQNAPVKSGFREAFPDLAFEGAADLRRHDRYYQQRRTPHGFMSNECARLDRRFRFPKLCTVAGMRRRYPGHKSYGLGKLCELYGIELETHHRALCDARATTRLLNLINQKREAAIAPDFAEEAA